MRDIVLLGSYLLGMGACFYMLRAIWMRDRDDWLVGTGAGLMIINAFGAGLAAAAAGAWLYVIVLGQAVGSVLLLRRPTDVP